MRTPLLALPLLALAAPSVHAAPAAGRETLTVPMPADPGAPAEPAAKGPRLVYLAFDGVTMTASSTSDDARTDTSVILSSVLDDGQSRTIAPFSTADLSSTQGFSRAEILAYTVDELDRIFAPYDVEFTLTRPASGSYHMVVFGGSCVSVAGRNDCAGIAPLDCGDTFANNIVYVFPPGLRIVDLPPTAAQELAHAFGLSHTTDPNDVMYPRIQGDTIPDSFGAGPIPDDPSLVCGNVTFQDSHEKLLEIVGFRGQDATRPSVAITSPAPGAVFTTDDVVTAEITDEGTIVGAELVLGGEVVDTDASAPYEFDVPDGAPFGQVFLTVVATDDSGNEGSHRVVAYLGSGDEEPCDDGRCPSGFACVDELCYPSEGGAGQLGDACEVHEDCGTGLCGEVSGEHRCTQSCGEGESCPSGFECLGGTACWPATEDEGEDGGGCAVGSEPRSALGGLGLALVALGAGRLRGRRRPR